MFYKSTYELLPPALDKLSSEMSAELNLSERDAVHATLRNDAEGFAEASSHLGTTGLAKHWLDTGDA